MYSYYSAYFYFTPPPPPPPQARVRERKKKSKNRERSRSLFTSKSAPTKPDDSPQPLIQTATRHTKKRRPTTSHILFKADPAHSSLLLYYCIYSRDLLENGEIFKRVSSIEREIWSIEEERTNARAKRVNDVATFRDTFSGGDKREKR